MKPKRQASVFRHIYDQPYQPFNSGSLYNSTKDSVGFVQRLGLLRKLPVHYGCVNCICWSDNGELLLSGSDDQRLVISHAYNFKKLADYKTSHRANIFSAKFLPNSGDRNIVSCSGDGIILFTDLSRTSDTCHNQFNCHRGTVYDVATVPDEPHTFLSCGEDSTVRCFDLRVKETCNRQDCNQDILISCQRAVTAIAVNGVAPHELAIGCSDSTVRLFDRRNLGTKSSGLSPGTSCVRAVTSLTAPGLEGKSYRITSLAYSPQGAEILVSYSSEHLYLFDCKSQGAYTTLEPSLDLDNDDDDGDDDDVDASGGGVSNGGAVGGETSGGDASGGGRPNKSRGNLAPSLPPIRRMRLRGDWSDTGPDARPERDPRRTGDVGQARPTLHATLMQRMTDVLSRMLNDPATRAALSHGGGEEEDEEEEGNPPATLEEEEEVDEEEEDESSIMAAPEQATSVVNNTRPVPSSPARSQLSEVSDGSEEGGSNNMVWSEDASTSVCQATASSSTSLLKTTPPQTTEAEKSLTLPSFESIYSSSYTSLVKSTTSTSNIHASAADCSSHNMDDVATLDSNMEDVATLDSSMEDVATLDSNMEDVATLDSIVVDVATLNSNVVDVATLDSNMDASADCSSNMYDAATLDRNVERVAPLDRNVEDVATLDSNMENVAKLNSNVAAVSSCSSVPSVAAPTSSSVADGPLPPPSSSSSSVESADQQTEDGSLSCLTDQLFTMRHGFIEKHGTEPMVNLHYSEKGSTASRITMSVGDEVNRELVASTSSVHPCQGANVPSSSPAAESRPTEEQIAGPSQISSPPSKPPEPMSQEDDSDDERELSSVHLNKRLIHPIERHMDSAIETARTNNSGIKPVNPLCEKTRVPKQTPVKMKFTGHRNARTMIKEARFWGADHVVSGSDCGHVFVWSRRQQSAAAAVMQQSGSKVLQQSGAVVNVLLADQHVVNCVQPHPHMPLLATSGIDYDVKVWAPIQEEAVFDWDMAEELMKRNEVMLEETRDTITVPASFMIRMLACLNQIRRGGRSRARRNESSE